MRPPSRGWSCDQNSGCFRRSAERYSSLFMNFRDLQLVLWGFLDLRLQFRDKKPVLRPIFRSCEIRKTEVWDIVVMRLVLRKICLEVARPFSQDRPKLARPKKSSCHFFLAPSCNRHFLSRKRIGTRHGALDGKFHCANGSSRLLFLGVLVL